MTPASFGLLARSAAERGHQLPCLGDDHNLWLAEDRDDRAQAARMCVGCPLLEPCADVATASRVTWGVWAGRDYTPPPQRHPHRPTEKRTR